MKVAFVPGLAEGHAHTRRLAACFEAAGHVVVRDLARAEAIIAHSGGCYVLPLDLTGKIVVIANPACLRRRLVPFVVLLAMYHELSAAIRQQWLGQWIRHTLLHSRYLLQTKSVQGMAAGIRRHNYTLPPFTARKVAVLTGQNDPWRASVTHAAVAANPTYCFLTMTGGHNDLWHHPNNWVNIVQYLYEA